MTKVIKIPLLEKLQSFKKALIAFLKTPLAFYRYENEWRQRRINNAVMHGEVLNQIAKQATVRENRCNHRKGGNGINSVINGTGTDLQYAVVKHTFSNGDTWVNCIRCGKKWKPGQTGYEEALKFRTHNSTSSGILFRFSDHGEHYRQAIKNS